MSIELQPNPQRYPGVPEPGSRALAEAALDAPAVQEISNLLWSGASPEFHRELVTALTDKLFSPVEGLTSDQATQLSYCRLEALCGKMRIRASDLVEHPEKLFALHDWVAYVDPTLCTLLSIHYSLCLGSILQHSEGREDLQDYIEELETFKSVGVFLATELGYGNNLVSLETQAIYDPERRDFELHTPTPRACKWMPNTAAPGIPKLAVVMARLIVRDRDCGIYPFIVRICDRLGPLQGIEISSLGEKAGYYLDNGVTRFDRVRVPKRNLLAGDSTQLDDDGTFRCAVPSRRKRFLDALDRVQAGRLNLSGSAVAAARGAALLALQYSGQRLTFAPKQADVPILSYRNQQREVFGALATAYACSFGVQHAREAWVNRTSESHDACTREISVIKAITSYRAAEIFARCRERCGAAGLFNENCFIPWWIAAQGLITAEGDNQVILLKSARQMAMGEGYEIPRTPATGDPLGRDLLDAEFQADLFVFREIQKVEELRWGLQSGLLAKRPLFEVWNEHVNLAIEAAQAHGVRLIFESFVEALARVRREGGRSALAQMCALFGLQEIAADLGWFVANGLITQMQAKRLSRERDNLCAELFRVAPALGEAFAIPENILSAPIRARNYVAEYARLAQVRLQRRHGEPQAVPNAAVV